LDSLTPSTYLLSLHDALPIFILFNDPLNLVAHKIGPAIASGNAIIVKPATLTPVSALLLAEAFVEAGLPDKILSVITGSGSEIRSEEHTSELQSRFDLVCRLL